MDFSMNANKIRQSYFNGFIDVSGNGGIQLRNDLSINFYDNISPSIPKFSIKPESMRIVDTIGTAHDISNTQLLYIKDLSQNVQSALNELIFQTQYITSDTSTNAINSGYDISNNLLLLSADILPTIPNKYNLGSTNYPFNSLYINEGTIHFINKSQDLTASLSYNAGTGSLDLSSNGQYASLTGSQTINGVYVTPVLSYNGNVGIGTKTPTCALDVSGIVNIIGNTLLTGSLSVLSGDLITSGNIHVGSSIIENGRELVNKYASIDSPILIGNAVLPYTTITGDLSLNGNAYIDGDVSMNGNVSVITQPITDNSSRVATTGYVQNQGYSTVDSPSFTGNVSLPNTVISNNFAVYGDSSFNGNLYAHTQATTNNSARVATTAYVKNQAYATVDSPNLTGTPVAPTPATGTNNTQVATTEFVTNQITNLVGSSNNLSIGLLNLKAPKLNPIFTGIVTAPTTIIQQTLSVSGDVSLNGKLFTIGDSSLNGNLFVGQNTYLGNDVSINHNLYVGNYTYLGSDVSINNNLDLSGSLITHQNISVYGVINQYTASLNPAGYTNFNTGGSGGSGGTGTISSAGNFVVSGDSSMNGQLFVGGNVYLYNDLFITGDEYVSNNLFVTNDVSFNGKLYVAEDVFINNNLFVNNDVSINSILDVSGYLIAHNNMNVYGIINQYTLSDGTMTMYANSGAMGGNVIVNVSTTTGILTATGDTTLQSRLFVSGDTTLESRLVVYNDASMNHNLKVGGAIYENGKSLISKYATLDSPTFTGTVNIANANINENLILNSDLLVFGNLQIGEDVFMQNNASVWNNLDVSGSLITHNNINVYGIINQYTTTLDQGYIVNYTTNYINNVTTETGDLSVNGIKLGNSTNGENTVVGINAASQLVSGINNTCIGYNSGSILTTGSNNIILGTNANSSTNTVSNEITIGNNSITTLRCQASTITSLSDSRDKTHIEQIPLGLDFISKLNPVKFEWNTRDGSKTGITDFGFIAQELQSVQHASGITVPNLVYANNPDKLEASYGALIPILVKAIQELKELTVKQHLELELLKLKLNA